MTLRRRLVDWSLTGLLVILPALVLLQAVAAAVMVLPEETLLPVAYLYDVPASLPVETLYATPESCSVPATDGKACIS